jgi:hypothetical protein
MERAARTGAPASQAPRADAPEWCAVTAGFDIGTPNMARVYGYWLGGKDHYAADREEAERLLMTYPPLRDLVRGNRAFVIQAVTWAARQGIQPVHRPGRRAPRFPSGPPRRPGGPAHCPGRVRRHRPHRVVPRPGAARHQRWRDRR